MPMAPPVLGARPRFEARRGYDADRRAAKASHGWYKLARWRAIRSDQLAREPLCRFCLTAGRVEPATVCDHVEPHREDAARFWSGPFQSLCAPCHSGAKQAAERAPPPPGAGGRRG